MSLVAWYTDQRQDECYGRYRYDVGFPGAERRGQSSSESRKLNDWIARVLSFRGSGWHTQMRFLLGAEASACSQVKISEAMERCRVSSYLSTIWSTRGESGSLFSWLGGFGSFVGAIQSNEGSVVGCLTGFPLTPQPLATLPTMDNKALDTQKTEVNHQEQSIALTDSNGAGQTAKKISFVQPHSPDLLLC